MGSKAPTIIPKLPYLYNEAWYKRYPGANPKLITSAKESSSLPKLLEALNFLATNPSIESKNAAKIIKRAAKKISEYPDIIIEINPQNKLLKVTILGVIDLSILTFTILKV